MVPLPWAAKERRISLSKSVSTSQNDFALWQPLAVPASDSVSRGEFVSSSALAEADAAGQGFQAVASHQAEQPGEDAFVALHQPASDPLSGSEPGSVEADLAEENPRDEPGPEEIARQAYAEGFARGEQEGIEAGRQESAEVLERLNGLLRDIESLWPDLIQTYEKEILELVFKAAEKVVLGRIAVDPEVVKPSLLHALELIPDPVQMTLEVHPEDYEYIETIKMDFFNQLKSLKHVNVISDPSVSRGGCRVHTPGGQVDATLEARLEAVRESILAAEGPEQTQAPATE